jgi:ATP-dependent DNA helicase RecQ
MTVMAEFERLSGLTPEWDWARCAVIAREWKSLDPVRSYCELKGIPVQQADEDNSGFWSLRETRSLVAWLRERPTRLIDAAMIRNWLAAQPDERWLRYLSEAQADYALEVGEAELPLEHFLDWLAEWGREARRRQTGLLLLSAHKAKGLEFDHVAVLDGNWLRAGSNEDADAPRRLYYVAITRARQTLMLARFARPHAWLDELGESCELCDSPAVQRRPPTALPPPLPELAYRYLRPSWKEINLDFSGTRPAAHPIHHAIAVLSVDDPLTLRRTRNGALELCTAQGEPVGRLSGSFSPPTGMHCIDARVASIHVRCLRDVGEEHRSRISELCATWEMIVPELVFAPDEPVAPLAQSHDPAPGNASPMA